jgi:hypothetical protein
MRSLAVVALLMLAACPPRNNPQPMAPAPAPADGFEPPVSHSNAPPLAEDGAACLAGGDCSSGVCEGLGCGDDAPGVCVTAHRACTRDYHAYCGCDGQTFNASGSCPGQRYAAREACANP